MSFFVKECCAWSVPKDFDFPNDNQDSFAMDIKRMTFAVADGVTNGSFASKKWSEALVSSFVSTSIMNEETWYNAKKTFDTQINIKKLKRFQKIKYSRGSYATFLGLSVCDSGFFDVCAYGDTTIFIFDDAVLYDYFPSNGFFDNPITISSLENRNVTKDSKLIFEDESFNYSGNLNNLVHPTIYLATDILAEWIIDNSKYHSLINKIGSQKSFARFVEIARCATGLKDDDTTLVKIVFERNHE